MPEVFISYAREDQAHAEQLYRELRGEGFDAWIDVQDLIAGSSWFDEISKAIRSAQYFVLLLSEKSMTKRGFVQQEIREALDIARKMPEGQIFLIPVRLEACEINDE